MKIQFYKYHGTGNDFIILDNRNQHYSSLTTNHIKHMCDRHFGIGADGLMLLNMLGGYDFEMKYYNADGHEASMCGNGGRCLVKFAFDIGLRKNDFTFIAVDGPHHANFDQQGWIQLKMMDVENLQDRFGDMQLDTGSPHYVKFVTAIQQYNVYEEGRKIRYSKDFKERGINVNFVEIMQEVDKIYVRTYERGVENETLSCGTGVTASALIFARNHYGFNRVQVQTPGGDLAVEFDKTAEGTFKNIWLCGPATKVFAGEIEV